MTAILYMIVALVIGIAVGAGILMLAARVAAGFMPKFLSAVAVVVVQFIAAMIVGWILGMVLGNGTFAGLVSLVVVFLVYSAITNLLLKKPDGSQLGFGKAALVTLVQLIIQIILGVILVFAFGTALLGIFGGMAAVGG
ncbi:hypothetical protein [Dokdonella sp.]|uniref:hypothetical protein n=1 Tax=Dokdonella sp. TaxID=2291710 RepID=UPI0025B85DC6|nr:hypothetical protein [Dokdonella sp.]MBX3690612.1 hypothetical protein [Dokdonella sp.]MCW5568737.1 hypothetical protein [Dokdonella sp.]